MLIITGLAFAFYIGFHMKSPLVYCVDGPYYLTQVRHIQRTGTLKYGDPPFSFYVFYVLSAILGLSLIHI